MTYNSALGTYSYPAATAPRPHAPTDVAGQALTYDRNGNMLSGMGRTIAYDAADRPVTVTANGQTTTYVYGPDDKRLKKVTGGNTTLYLGDDEEHLSDGTVIKHIDGTVRRVGSVSNWMHRDHLSSIRLMTDATGTQIAENRYRPYGERTDVQLAVNTPRESRGWIGERDDPETGLTYLNARYYDPALGRFITPDWFDPTDRGVGTNRYAYGMNNPIMLKDPSGNIIDTILDIVFVGYDVGKISYDFLTEGEVDPVDVAALGADLAATVTPFATGAGPMVRAGAAATNTTKEATKAIADKAAEQATAKAKKASDLIPNTVESVENAKNIFQKNRNYWSSEPINFKGHKVFQRNDLIDPNLVDERGRTNLERMQNGLAPLGPDGKPLNLHHMTQRNDGPIAEMAQTFHQKNSKTIHINPNTVPSGIDRKNFNKWRSQYWKARAIDF